MSGKRAKQRRRELRDAQQVDQALLSLFENGVPAIPVPDWDDFDVLDNGNDTFRGGSVLPTRAYDSNDAFQADFLCARDLAEGQSMFVWLENGEPGDPADWSGTFLMTMAAQYAPDIEKARTRVMCVLNAHEQMYEEFQELHATVRTLQSTLVA